jgi:hypothetical protein
MKLDTDFLNKLQYKEVSLKEIELDIMPTEKDDVDYEDSSGVGFGSDKYLTERALKQLCDILMLPYKFTQILRFNGKPHVIPYIQKQLSQLTPLSVVTVEDGKNKILSIVDKDMLHFNGKDALVMDKRIKEALNNHPILELKEVLFSKGDLSYSIYYKEPQTIKADKDSNNQWEWGFTLRYSTLGLIEPIIGMEVTKRSTVGKAYLPQKTYSCELPQTSEFELKWEYIQEFLDNPPSAGWTDITNMITKLKVPASFREVTEARNRLLKLKVDKFDKEVSNRVTKSLQWKRIQEAYGVKELEVRPPRRWFASADTPLSLFDVFNIVSKEATHAPNTVDTELRQNLLKYAGALLAGDPDLYNLPPVINWDTY